MTLLRAVGQRRSPLFPVTAAKSERQQLQQLARTTSKPQSLAAAPVGANSSSSRQREGRANAASFLFSFWRELAAISVQQLDKAVRQHYGDSEAAAACFSPSFLRRAAVADTSSNQQLQPTPTSSHAHQRESLLRIAATVKPPATTATRSEKNNSSGERSDSSRCENNDSGKLWPATISSALLFSSHGGDNTLDNVYKDQNFMIFGLLKTDLFRSVRVRFLVQFIT
uniref:Uncharacterized protein n=1 Tax=Solanum tuberosum TaxID=4113 RepID=M1DUH2_SOLTU